MDDRFSRDWWIDSLLGTPLRVVSILLLGLVVRYVAIRLIRRLVARTAGFRPPERLLGSRRASALLNSAPIATERHALRAKTLGSLFESVVTAVVLTVVAIMVLAEVGFQVAPIIASAGILGVALGFGAQNLVKDFLSGVFMLIEDQYGVGDVIDLGQARGVVESVGLRVTRLRDTSGTVWYVRNGEVLRVGNQSQGWGRAVVDVGIGVDQDYGRARELLSDVAARMAEDEAWSERLLGHPEVWGVREISADRVVLRVTARTKPQEEASVGRELTERVKASFDEAGIPVVVISSG